MKARRHTAPEGMDVVPRHMGFSFGDTIPKYWYDGDPWATQMFNALSLTFPSGEQMFIDSVRHFRDRVTDPVLAREVKGFIAQESQHRREHDLFNRWLERQGLPVEEVYAWFEEMIASRHRILPHEARLAVTCALEHFTAIMADAFLTDEELLAKMDERVRPLWIWHAIEETEHKAVAFDVYEAIGGTYGMRVRVMVLISINFLINTTITHQRLLRVVGEQRNYRSAARYLRRFWGPRGAFTKLVPAYLDYFRRDFHPWQQDNREVIARYKAEIEAQAKRLMPLPPVGDEA